MANKRIAFLRLAMDSLGRHTARILVRVKQWSEWKKPNPKHAQRQGGDA